ncbi:MAG: hypothetical protein KBI41_02605 [Kiritimatiellae bacterium]|jgi:hypothetical protein|nr:hypothetical protein [Kiritimatiellia bacterium]MDD3583349.1 UPF0158 family protein [Kiritimatiellia bacterium]
MPTYDDLESAFYFVSCNFEDTNRAVYDKVTDQFFYASDDIDEIPEEADGKPERYVDVPNKNDLDLGRSLVFRFVRATIPDAVDAAYNIFRRAGAYSRFKYFLEERGLLQQWYDYENAVQREALQEWCEENGIKLSEKEAP